jgi:hypothetical protein
MFPIRYRTGFYIPEHGITRRHRREDLNSYIPFKYIFFFRSVVEINPSIPSRRMFVFAFLLAILEISQR